MKKTLLGGAGLVALILWSTVVWGTVGGPSYVTDVRYDPASRSVYYVHVSDDADWPPSVESFRIGRANEFVSSAVTQSSWQGGRDPSVQWEAWSQRLDSLPALQASMSSRVRLRVLGVRSDTTGTEWWGPYERRIALVEVRSGGLVGRTRITSYLDHTIRLCNVYEVPGGRRLVILRARGIPFEGTYDVDTPVLLTPPS